MHDQHLLIKSLHRQNWLHSTTVIEIVCIDDIFLKVNKAKGGYLEILLGVVEK